MQALGQKLGVLGSSVSLGLGVLNLVSLHSSLSLESLWGNESLDLWSLGVGLVSLGDLSSDNKVSNVVLLGQTEELSDVVGSLWSESLWSLDVGESLDVGVTLLGDDQVKGSNVVTDDATTDGLSLSLTGSSWSVTTDTLDEEELDSAWEHNTLLHGETLFIVTSSDLEDVSLELVSDEVSLDLGADSLLVEVSELQLIVNLDALLRAVGWVGNVQLHGDDVLTRRLRESKNFFNIAWADRGSNWRGFGCEFFRPADPEEFEVT